ncbi:nitrilase-related carbon-nitrogen hydrolase [Amycolatopsis vastitatis]|uniref:Acyltransferase n=1 Tax=Amycolatopsis vastitatis TaxID=1905142 RepID=A0A229TBZ9_9PSEU|nr:nitrilase-related carbon-nitrogen hydrolase [Amycolatopsis vastitatis]OXM68520.1 acyltransferase [Amycolatopsis vastitatis]
MDSGRERANRARGLVAAALVGSAVLFFFGTGLTPVATLTWLAPLPVLLVAPRVSCLAAVTVAFVAFLLGTANSWAFQLRSHDTPLWPIGLLIDAGLAAVFAVTVAAFRLQLRRGRAVLATVTAPAVWTGVLYLVSITNPMGLGGTMSNLQGDVPVVLQAAAATGMWGVEFLVLLVPSALAVVLAPGFRAAARVRAGALAVTLLVVGLGAGALRLASEDAGPVRRVAAIATNQRAWAPNLASPAGRDLVAAYVDRIAALPAGVQTIVLPEQSFSSSEARPAALLEPMRQAAAVRRADIVVGFAYSDGKAKYNYALVFPADGGEPLTYLKHHDAVSPPGHDLVFVPGGETGVEICFDVNFPRPSRDYAQAGARILAIPASDEDDNGWQHSRTALVRGVENGQAVIWSDRTGTVLISDGWGRVRADAHTGGPGPFTTLVADVPLGPGATPYSRFGDWYAWLCLAVALSALVTAFPARKGKPPRDGSRTARAGSGNAEHGV